MKVDLGKLTEEETAEVAGDALSMLKLAERVKVVLAAFAKDERDELMSHLDEAEDE